MTVYKKLFSAVTLGVVVAVGWQAEAGFVVDNFDGYTLPKTVNQLGNGWGADDNTAVVTNNLPVTASQGIFLPQLLTVSNAVSLSGASYPHVWTECAVYDSGRLIPGTEPVPSGNEGVMLGVSTGGYAVVYDPGVTNWVTYTNDVWGTTMHLETNAWAVFSVLENFGSSNAAVFLNGHLMRLGLPFISNSLANYGAFKSIGGNLTNGFLDNVFISNAIPASLTLDLDNDGKADALEIEQYGNVTTWRRLTNTVSATGSGSINPTGTFTVISGSNVTYTLTGGEAYGVGSLTNNGVVTNFAAGMKTATYTDLNVTSDRTITAAFVYNGIRYVPSDHLTITGALAVAHAGDQIVASNGTYAGSITVSNGVVLVGTNMTGGAGDTNLTINGAMTVVQTGTVYSAGAPGQFTVTGTVSIAVGGLLTISNTAASFGGLATGAGGKVVVSTGSSLAIGGITNGPGTYWTVTNMVTSAGNGTITPSGTNTMISTWQDVTYALTGAEAYVVGSLTNNGVVTNFTGTKIATYTDSKSNITNDQVITAAFVRDGIHYVPGDHTTITDTLAVAQGGDQIVVSNGTYAGSITVSNGVTLIGTNMTAGTGNTNLTINGAMTVVQTGMVYSAGAPGQFTVTGMVSIAAGGLLTISNTAANFGGLSIGGGGMLQVVNGSLVVGSYTNWGPTFTLTLVTNTASSAGNGTITPLGTSTMISTWSNVVYSLQATNAGYVVGAVTNNGVSVGGGAIVGAGTKTATYTDPAANITNNQNIIAAFVYNGIRYVPSDHLTITGALAVAQAGDVIVVSNAVYDGSVTLSNRVMLVGTNLGVNATNLTVNGTMTVVTGTVSTATGAFTVTGQVTIAAGGLLTISNTAVNFNGLTFGAGGEVQVVNGALTVYGVTRTGTFTLDANSFNFKASTLNFTDGFENYLTGTTLASLGAFGWAATDVGALVTNGAAVVSQGAKAAFIPAGVSVSNTVSAAGITNVWTELYVKDDAQVTPETQPPVVANSAVMVYFGTNGYLTVYNFASNAWDVCSNDVTMGPVARVNAGQWARVSIFQNFSNHTAAIFLNDQLLREQVPFISAGVSQYGSMSVVCGQSGSAGLDAVKIWTNVPGLVGDLNFDRIPDASEITLNGTIRVYPRGTVYLIR